VAGAFDDPAGNPDARCALLAPATRSALELRAGAPCPQVLGRLGVQGGSVRSGEVWAVFSRSLGLLMGALFLLTWAASAVSGWAACNSQQLRQREDPVGFLGHLGEADFWNRSLQNWQSEMLAVGSMAVFSAYLRQRGSPESTPVGAPHELTGASG
jgi:hypothetical protein